MLALENNSSAGRSVNPRSCQKHQLPSKTYRQLCSVARALDVVGERWTLLLIRDLFAGPQSYSSLLAGLPGLTTNLLAKRLRTLLEAGLIERVKPDATTIDGAARGLYALSEAGTALAPVIVSLGDWGSRYGAPPAANATLNPRLFLILLGRCYCKVEGRWLVQLNVAGHKFQIRLGVDEYESMEGAPWTADLCIDISSADLHALLMGECDPEELVSSGRAKLDGSKSDAEKAWRGFQASFGLGA
ncbi:MAG: DNA-binding HxlR family transcriptional regulator [Planctomycetota bacterium]